MAPQILVAFDFSESSELALKHAVALALEETPRDFHFLIVLDPRKGLGLKKEEVVNYQYTEEVQELATKHISESLANLDPGGEVTLLVHVRIGDPVKSILEMATEVGASLIVLGSHGRTGVKRVLLGSLSERVVREAECPVLVTRDRTYEDVERDEVVEAPESNEPEFVAPHRYHYNSGVPKRPKAWALY